MCAVSLLVADDHEIVRRGIRALIREQSEWRIVAEAEDGRDAVTKAAEFQPDVAILDITMPLLNGLDAAKQIAKLSPHTKILILTVHESDQLIRQALDAGAAGYLFKTDASFDLITAVKALLSAKAFFTPKVSQMVLRGYLGKGPTVSEHEPNITAREREIVQLLAEGKHSKEVAAVLEIGVKTVESHRSNILRKLHFHSVTELVRYAVRNHIVEA